jgi:hypothetical protein
MGSERFALDSQQVARCANRQGLGLNGGRRREETIRFAVRIRSLNANAPQTFKAKHSYNFR